MKIYSLLLAVLFPLSVSVASAQVFVYRAINDFPNINATEVPYYRDRAGDRDVLAINAAIEDFRDKFARAETSFEGEEGTYDVTIAALGEIDGECVYRFLVNGAVKGIATNSPVDVDYGVQNHIFRNINIPAGATIAVESKAVSNGLIPENDEFAFARGRWRTLTISNYDPTPTPDLSLEISASSEIITIDDDVVVTFNVSNFGAATATSPTIEGTLSDGMQFVSSVSCEILDDVQFSCVLPEIVSNRIEQTSLTVNFLETGELLLSASVSSDQADGNSGNNSNFLILNVSDVNSDLTDEPPIDENLPDGEIGQANASDEDSAGGSTSFGLLLILFSSLTVRRSRKLPMPV